MRRFNLLSTFRGTDQDLNRFQQLAKHSFDPVASFLAQFFGSSDPVNLDSEQTLENKTLTGSLIVDSTLSGSIIDGFHNTLSNIQMSSLSPVYFFARNNGVAQSINNNSKTTVTFGTEELDSHGALASSIFTVPAGQAGIYVFHAAVLYAPTTTLTEARAFLTFNDSLTDVGAGTQDGIAQPRTIFAHALVSLAVGDNIRVKARQVNAGAIAQNITGDAEQTYFMGQRIA
jgi:hypothetical protein